MIYNQSRSGFELVLPCPFPTTITITPRAPLTTGTSHYGLHKRVININERGVIKVLHAKGKNLTYIHRDLVAVCDRQIMSRKLLFGPTRCVYKGHTNLNVEFCVGVPHSSAYCCSPISHSPPSLSLSLYLSIYSHLSPLFLSFYLFLVFFPPIYLYLYLSIYPQLSFLLSLSLSHTLSLSLALSFSYSLYICLPISLSLYPQFYS